MVSIRPIVYDPQAVDYSLDATFYRTALLLGLIRGDVVHRWVDEVIAQEAQAPAAFFEAASIPPADLSALRHALWPLVVDPAPTVVLARVLAVLHEDLVSGRRGLADTLTIVRQMRSMLRLPPDLYADLNAALVAHAADPGGSAIAGWLHQFAATNPAPRGSAS